MLCVWLASAQSLGYISSSLRIWPLRRGLDKMGLLEKALIQSD